MSGGAGRTLVIAAAVAIVATVAAAVVVMGPPWTQRQARLDERRVQDLVQLQAAIEDHARREDRLPASLDALDADTGRALSLADPVDGTPYAYEPRDARRYRLCARFATDTRDDRQVGVSAGEGWRHPAGHHCFERAAEPRAVRADAVQPMLPRASTP